MYEYTSKFVNSVVICNDHTTKILKELTDLAIEEKACVVFMFHSVVKAGEDNHDNLWSFDYDKFNEFAEYLYNRKNEGKLDILTTKDAYLT